MRTAKCSWALALVAVVFLAGVATADGIIVLRPPMPPHPIRPFPVPPPPPVKIDPLEIRAHNVTVEIRDGMAVTKVDQIFFNPNRMQLEGTYLFPVPEDASISAFSMFIDGKETKAELLDRDKARKIYEDIVRTMRDPALLEYVNRRTFQARVFPIPANGEKRIKLEYSEPLPVDNGLMTYRYPLNTEKFSGKPLKECSVVVTVNSALPLKGIVSPSHAIDIAQKDERHARISFEANNTLPDKDFVLYISIGKAAFGLNLVTYRAKGEDGYFLAMISPGVEVDAGKVLPKDLVLALDTSGSMAQDGKITQARNALKYCLRHLNAGDRFNIIDFSTTARTFRDKLVAADTADIDAALAYVEAIEAVGGTAIAEALDAAVKMAPGGERPYMVIFLTDGQPTIGVTDTNEILKSVQKAAAGKLRLFTFGVGNEVNTVLLDRLAEDNRGTRAYVAPGEDIETKVSSFYRKVSSPVLADLKLELQGITVEDVYPRNLGDLFRGAQLTVVGRYRGAGDHAAILTGNVNGTPRRLVYEGAFAEESTAQEFLPRYWAVKKIGYLIDEIRLHGEQKELKDEIVRLSRTFGIMTPYTSFLVTEDVKATAARPGAPHPEPMLDAARRMEERAAAPMIRAEGAMRATSGKGAVEFSRKTNELRDKGLADSESVLGATAREVMIQLGPQTYYKRDGVWMVSSYDGKRKPERVIYLSDEYFALAQRSPLLARAFALGPRVIAEWNGTFYEVAAGE